MADQTKIVIVGSGVIGLTTALELSRDRKNSVTVVAKHMTGDWDPIQYVSPTAGANFIPLGEPDAAITKLQKKTFPVMLGLAKNHPEAGLEIQAFKSLNRDQDSDGPLGPYIREIQNPNAWYKDMVPGFRFLDKSEIPAGFDTGVSYQTISINVPVYLGWLNSEVLKNDVVFKRAEIRHISEAAALHPLGKADVVVNCTGFGAIKLAGVQDKEMFPVRGQSIIVRNETSTMAAASSADDGNMMETGYVIPRPAGGGTILGGSYQIGSWDDKVDPTESLRIMRRALELAPDLTKGKGIDGFDVVKHQVGLRPCRPTGPRVEKEQVGDTTVIHNYGHGGLGFQFSYGSAMEVSDLIRAAA